MDNERIEKLVKTLPCAASDCGMYEGKAKEAITELLKEERNRVIDEVLKLQFGIEGPHGLITVVRVDEIESLKGKQQ